jgi:hypothetical protein
VVVGESRDFQRVQAVSAVDSVFLVQVHQQTVIVAAGEYFLVLHSSTVGAAAAAAENRQRHSYFQTMIALRLGRQLKDRPYETSCTSYGNPAGVAKAGVLASHYYPLLAASSYGLKVASVEAASAGTCMVTGEALEV